MPKLQFTSRATQALQEAQGSDARLNVSSRSDDRIFYVSRDNGQAYVLSIVDADAVAGDIVGYLRNDSDSKQLNVKSVRVSTENAATFKVHFGDNAVATGATVVPTNLNKASANAADTTAFGNGAVGGVAASMLISTVRAAANSSEPAEFADALILGQNGNIIIEYDAGSTGAIEIDIFFFLE